MLKLLVVMPCYYPAVQYGGPVVAVHQMNKALVRQGVDVTVFTTHANGTTFLDVPTCKEINVDGVKVFYFPIPFGASYFYSPRLKEALKKSLMKYDVVHINWMYVYTTMVAARLCIKMNIPYVLTPHGMLDSYSSSLKGTWKKKIYVSCIEKPHILGAAAIHFNSLGEKNEAVINDWAINPVIVPNGVELQDSNSIIFNEDLFYRKYPNLLGKQVVLSIGRLNYIKGLDILLIAWSRVVGQVADAHLVIAGPDSNGYMAKLQAIVIAEGITDSVTFTGIVLGEEKAQLLSAAKMYVSSSYLESFGMSIVEGMACALPVAITNRVNIKTEIESAKAGLVSMCEPTSMAENIVYLLQHKDEAIQIGKRGQALVSNTFEMNLVVKQMIILFHNVIEK